MAMNPDATKSSARKSSSPARMPRSDKVSSQIARRILDQILADRLPPGSMLPAEAEMLRSYGVGRASIREALRILEVHGIVAMKPGPRGGPVVADVNAADFGRSAALHFHVHGVTMRDVIAARLVLEPMMARMAAGALSDESVDTLRAAVADGEEMSQDPGPGWGNSSVDYHELIGTLAGNRALTLLCNSLAAVINARIRPVFPVGGRGEVLKAHSLIVEAILAGDGRRAEQRMRKHLEALGERMSSLIPGLLDDVIEWG